ncbi:pyridoxamine 5'-phosphate oxidase family protein [Rhizosaccharibacter radicis]|uniref:Pyridoxamine 5'-phosphate oxidase family protein n=1 Tax=Rhizosaccharibacter radicis TaxID=2782605 RepID=A0ABT1W0G6_9PROT|nr:pyridoxamine 5'-phosphate oxidase family protein [Acetobacteraceae bacterium KSS12]
MPASSRPFIADALDAVARAARDRDGELRTVQLATLGTDGAPSVRSVVLRALEGSEAELHSDARAGKVRDVRREPRVSLLAWSAEAKLQLRLDGTALLHEGDAFARERWDALPDAGRTAYGARAAPGEAIDDPGDRRWLQDEERFRCFVVMRVRLHRVEVLRLEPHGNQTRAVAGLDRSGALHNERWIGP